MADSLPRRIHRFVHIDADPRAAAGTPQRLGWEYVCAWMDLLDFLQRARRAGPEGRLSPRDRTAHMRKVVALFGASAAQGRARMAASHRAALSPRPVPSPEADVGRP